MLIRSLVLCLTVFLCIWPVSGSAQNASLAEANGLVLASYYVWKGDQFLSRNDHKAAVDCYILAASKLENSPLPHFKLAKAYLRTSLTNAILETVIGLKLLSDDFFFQSLLLSNILIVSLIGLSIALYACMLTIVVRHSLTIYASISNLKIPWLSKLAPETVIMAALASFLIAMPAKSPIGILTWSLMVGGGLSWRFATAGEKKVIIAFLVYLISVGYGIDFVAKVVSTQHPKSEARLTSIVGVVDNSTLARILNHTNANPSKASLQTFIEGFYYLRSGENAKAATVFGELLEKNKDDTVIMNNLAVALFRLGRYQESRAVWERAIKIDPNQAILHYNYAQALNSLLDFGTAEEELSKASTLDFHLIRSLLTSKTDAGPIPLTIQDQKLWAVCLSQINQPLKVSYHPLESGRVGLLVLSLLTTSCILVSYKSRPSPKCTICGLPLRRLSRKRKAPETICTTCSRISHGLADHRWADAECKQRRKALAKKKMIATLLFGLIVPGVPYHLIGRRLTGFFLTFVFACLMTLGFFNGWVVKPLPYIGIRQRATGLITMIAITYAVYTWRMLVTTLRKTEETV